MQSRIAHSPRGRPALVLVATLALALVPCPPTFAAATKKPPPCNVTALQEQYGGILAEHEARVANRSAASRLAERFSAAPPFDIAVDSVSGDGSVGVPNLLSGIYPGYDVRSGAFTFANPTDMSQTSFTTHADSTGSFAFTYLSSTNSISSNIDASVSAKGGGFGVKLSASASYASSFSDSATSTTFVMFMSMTTSTETADYSSAALSKYARLLADTDPAGFLDTFGTHAVLSKTRGCSATMTATYSFSSSAAKKSFDASVSASVGLAGVFSATVGASLDTAASQAETGWKLVVSVVGDAVDQAISQAGASATTLEAWAKAFEANSDWTTACEKLNPAPVTKATVTGWSTFSFLFGTAVYPLLQTYSATKWGGLATLIAKANVLSLGLAQAVEFITRKVGGSTEWTPRLFSANVSACDEHSTHSDALIEGASPSTYASLQEGLDAVRTTLADFYDMTDVGDEDELEEKQLQLRGAVGSLWNTYNPVLLQATSEWTIEIKAKVVGPADLLRLSNIASFASVRRFNTMTTFFGAESGVLLGGYDHSPRWYHCGGIGFVVCGDGAPVNSIGISVNFGVQDSAVTYVQLKGARFSGGTGSYADDCAEYWWLTSDGTSSAKSRPCAWLASTSVETAQSGTIATLSRGLQSSVTFKLLPDVTKYESRIAIEFTVTSTPTKWGSCSD